MQDMDKHQDADLEKRELVDVYFEDDRAPLFETDDEFEEHGTEENEFDYEPEGAFLD
jgi:hypothetical protein